MTVQSKCDEYWPSRGSELYGWIHVTLADVIELATYTVRTFHLAKVRLAVPPYVSLCLSVCLSAYSPSLSTSRALARQMVYAMTRTQVGMPMREELVTVCDCACIGCVARISKCSTFSQGVTSHDIIFAPLKVHVTRELWLPQALSQK